MLTAQEALIQEGFIVLLSDKPDLENKVVPTTNTTISGIPIGAPLFIKERITIAEAVAFGERVGWNEDKIFIRFAYKAIAE